MENVQIQTENNGAIHILYDTILNKQQFEKVNAIISEDYTNVQGAKGIVAFQKLILELIKAFPDAQWKIEEIIAEGNKVIVKQKFTGTQKSQFQSILPTNKFVSVDGIATYEFKNKKIIHSQIQTDRLSFLQQLNVLPIDISTLLQINETKKALYFVDKFFIPKSSINEFIQRMKYNRSFIRKLSGFIKDDVYEQKDEEGNLIIITIAAWQSQDHLNDAKNAVQTEYKRIEFNQIQFYQRLNIKMDRGQYTILND